MSEPSVGIFLDGTGADLQGQTNIAQLKRAYRGEAHYVAGPGNPSTTPPGWIEKAAGNAFGRRSGDYVEVGYNLVVDAWKRGARQVDIFGFSRGAAEANELAWRLHQKGIVDPNTHQVLAKPGQVPVRFLGLFDTVYSMGAPAGLSKVYGRLTKSQLNHPDQIAPNVGHAAHALAIHEPGAGFAFSDPRPTGAGTKLDLHAFPGVHSDVGGHAGFNPVLGALSRSWMADKALAAGAPVDRSLALSADQLRAMLTPEKLAPTHNPMTWDPRTWGRRGSDPIDRISHANLDGKPRRLPEDAASGPRDLLDDVHFGSKETPANQLAGALRRREQENASPSASIGSPAPKRVNKATAANQAYLNGRKSPAAKRALTP